MMVTAIEGLEEQHRLKIEKLEQRIKELESRLGSPADQKPAAGK